MAKAGETVLAKWAEVEVDGRLRLPTEITSQISWYMPAAEVEVVLELREEGSLLIHAGFRIAEVAVNHRARQFGHSKYGFRRFLRGFLDLITVTFLIGFGQRPQHMLGAVGLVSFLQHCNGAGVVSFDSLNSESRNFLCFGTSSPDAHRYKAFAVMGFAKR